MTESSLSILATPSSSKPSRVLTLKETLSYQADRQPQKEAYVFYNEDGIRISITFSELFRKCKEFSSSMKQLTIKARDVIIVAMGNSVEFVIVQFGLMMIGAIPLTTLPSMKNGSDLMHLVKQSNAIAIILPTENKGGHALDLSRFIKTVTTSTVKFVISSDGESDKFGCLSLKQLMRSTKVDDTLIDDTLDIDDVGVIMPTSGTTGSSKLVCHSYRNVYNMFKFEDTSTPFGPEKLFSSAAFAWLGGSPLKNVFNGITCVTITGDRWKMSAEAMLQIVEKESCDTLKLSPDFISSIITRNIPIPKSVSSIYTGGAPIPPYFQKLLESVDYLFVRYGLLETGGISGSILEKNATVEGNIGGTPRPGVKIKIVDDNNEIVRRGFTGKIMVKTPFSCLSYLGETGLNNIEWVDTEDMGYISDEGQLFVVGRQVDCITVGAVTSYVCQFEQIIMSIGIPGILEVVVVPVPDKITYQKACACIIKESGAILTETSILETLEENVFSSRKPKYVLFVDSFPRNQNGKVDRRLMRETAMQKLLMSE